MLRFSVLASGSAGNSYFVASDSTRLLVDAGLSCRETRKRLRGIGEDLCAIQAVLLTHEHGDHTGGIETITRSYRPDIYSSEGTGVVFTDSADRVRFTDWHVIDGPFEVGDLSILPVPVSHDAAEPIAFVIEHNGVRAGIATDLGSIDWDVRRALAECDLILLESNHDADMLAACPYDFRTKTRIGAFHLSNDQVSDFIHFDLGERVSTLILGHISENANTAELARLSAAAALRERDHPARVEIAMPGQASRVFGVSKKKSAAVAV